MDRSISVVIINISVFLLMIGVGMIMTLLPRQILNLTGSVASVGYLASSFAVTYVLFQIPVGLLSDKMGFKPFLISGYFICSLAGLLYYVSTSSLLVYFARMLQGVGEVPIWAIAPALLAILYPDHKGKFMGLYNACLHCGLTTGSFLGILLPRFCQGQDAFLIFSGISFVGGLLIFLWVKPVKKDPGLLLSRIRFKDAIWLLKSSTLQKILFGIALYGAGYGIFVTIIPGFLATIPHTTPASVGIFFIFFYMAMGVSQLIAGYFSDKKGRKPFMLCGLLMAAVGLATFDNFNQTGFIGLLSFAAIGLGIFCASAMAFLNECVPTSLKGTISGVFFFSWGLGYFIGPLVLGRLADIGKLRTGFLCLSALLLLESIILWFGIKSRPQKICLTKRL